MVSTSSKSRPERKGFAKKTPRRPFLQIVANKGVDNDRPSLFRLSPREERRVVERARKGDPVAIRQLVELLSGPVFRYGQGFCGHREDAEDVAQHVLVAMIQGLDRFRGEASLSTWAYTVARRACVRQRKKDGFGNGASRISSPNGQGEDIVLAVPDPGNNPARDFERRNLRARLTSAIASLPPRYREVLILRDVEGLPASRVADILGLGERAVKSRLHRARSAVRRELAMSERGESSPEQHRKIEATAEGGKQAKKRDAGSGSWRIGAAATSPVAKAPGPGQRRHHDDHFAPRQSGLRGAESTAAIRNAAAGDTNSPEIRAARCPDIALYLSRFLEGELDRSTCGTIEAHVSTCSSCGDICATLRSVLVGCRAWRKEKVPAKVKSRVQAALRQWVETNG